MNKHFLYYVGLTCVLLAGIVLVGVFSYDKTLQFSVVAMMAVMYVVLGVIHHMKDHSMTSRVMVEYVAMAVLGIAISYFIVKLYV